MDPNSVTNLLTKQHFTTPIDPGIVRADWAARGYSCHDFVDPPGQQWLDFVHDTNELVTVVEGHLRLTVAETTVEAGPGDEVFIPKGANHSVVNIHGGTTHWLFGYD